MEKKIKFKIYYLFYLIPVAAMAYLFWQNTKPVLEARCDFKKKTALCGALVPTSRVAAVDSLRQPADGGGVLIKEEPVYFDARIPRGYDRVEAEIEYTDLAADILEFGVARDEAKKNFEFAPLENKILDNLGWKKISAQGGSVSGGEQDGLVLYQKNPVYKNIADFSANPPKFFETLVYRADLAPKLEKMTARGNTVIDFPVRGNIKLLVYKAGSAPQVTVDFSVIPVFPFVIPAKAGIQSNNDEIPYQVRNDKIGQNLYAINLAGSEEAVFTKISVDSPYAAIADKIKIGRLDKPLTIYFAGSRLFANAHAAGGAQKIDANGQIINIEKIKEQYVSVFKNIKLRPVEIPKGDVELGASLFFISDKNIFYSKYEPFYANADLSKINYILAKYQPPQEGSIKTTQINFNISDTPTPGGKLRFIISLPNALKGELVRIKSVKIKFSGEKFGIKKIFRKLLSNMTM